MKTNFKKTLAVLLTLLMAFSCMSIAVSAATKENVEQYGAAGGYLAIGDSISRGCGADGFSLTRNNTPAAPGGRELDAQGKEISGGFQNQYDDYEVRDVEGSLPYQIAQAVGCNAPKLMTENVDEATYWPFVYPGMTTAAAVDLYGIDDGGYIDDVLCYDYYDSMMEYFGYNGSSEAKYSASESGIAPKKYRLNKETGEVDAALMEKNAAKIAGYANSYAAGEYGKCGNIIELTKSADLITVQLGMCDVFYRAYRIINNDGMLKDGFNISLDNLGGLKDIVVTAISEMINGFNKWKELYPLLLDAIKELNPDATVVIVGAFNVVNQLTITDETMFPLGSMFSKITNDMNKLYKQWAKEYGFIYADVSNTEIKAAELDWSLLGDFMDDTFTGTHPTQTGYNYMVRQVLSVLPEKDDSKNIKVDLARFTKVDYVLLNGIKISEKEYSMDGYELTINYDGPLGVNLTIGVVNDDGSIAVQTYSLKYGKDGYTAHRLYGHNDIVELLKRPIALIKMLFNLIKGLFN